MLIKLRCESKVPGPSSWTIYFYPVYAYADGTRVEENLVLTDGTPNGLLHITIDNGKPAAELYQVGDYYDLTLTQFEPPEPAPAPEPEPAPAPAPEPSP